MPTASETPPTMLDDELKAQLKEYLRYLKRPIRITAALDGGDDSAALRGLLDDVAAASSLVEVVELEAGGEGPPATGAAGVRRPSFAIHLPGEAPRVRFAGLPLGHEFTSLVLALLHVGGHPPKVSDDAARAGGRSGRVLLLRDVLLPVVSELSRRRAGPEPDRGAQSERHPRRDRRRHVSRRGRGTSGDGGADRLPERRASRPRSNGARGAAREDRHRRGGAPGEGARCQGRLRHARRRRGTGGGGGRHLRGAQGAAHRRGRGSFRRPGPRHARHRELHLGHGDRGSQARRRPRGARRRLSRST